MDHNYAFDWSAISTEKLTANGQYTVDVSGNPLDTPVDKFDGSTIATEVFADTVNSFLTVTGTVTYRDGQEFYKESDGSKSTNPSCIEIKGDALTVTFTGTGTLSISVSSTGKSNWSSIALKDANGNFITPTYTANDNIAVTDKAGIYAVKTTTAQTLTFAIETAGTYTICVDKDALVDTANCNRPTRVLSLVMVDKYVEA